MMLAFLLTLQGHVHTPDCWKIGKEFWQTAVEPYHGRVLHDIGCQALVEIEIYALGGTPLFGDDIVAYLVERRSGAGENGSPRWEIVERYISLVCGSE